MKGPVHEPRVVDLELEFITGSGFGSLGFMSDTATSTGVESKKWRRGKPRLGWYCKWHSVVV